MKYAVIRTGGKQYKVSEGDELLIEKLDREKGKAIVFDEVLLLVDGQKVTLGKPLIKGATVKAEILEQIRGKKIRVAKFRAKSRYRKVKGHRQKLTKVKIKKIHGKGKN
jgi:large subunit ribosomal protein L21